MINLSLRIDKTKWHRHVYVPFLDRLEILFSEMDRKYDEVADFYGFVCTGCENNCCLTRFYHHSLLEYLYLYEGYVALAQENTYYEQGDGGDAENHKEWRKRSSGSPNVPTQF